MPCSLLASFLRRQPHPRHPEQFDLEVAAGVADERRPPVRCVALPSRFPSTSQRVSRVPVPLARAVKIDGTTVEWDELHFDVRLLQRVPCAFLPLARIAHLRPSRLRLTVSNPARRRGCLPYADFAAPVCIANSNLRPGAPQGVLFGDGRHFEVWALEACNTQWCWF